MVYNESLSKVLDFADREWSTMDLLFNSLKEDLSLQILNTEFDDSSRREELYYVAKAIDALAIKIQGCINECKAKQGDN